MKVGVVKELEAGERRVSIVPDVARRLVDAGVDVIVETGAGAEASFLDEAYEEAGAEIAPNAESVYTNTDVICKVRVPADEEVSALRRGSVLIALIQPLANPELVQKLAEQGITSFSMDSIPRITRAQPMDALSSQSTVGGYKAALLAAGHLGKFFPMLTTAAGTIPPAQVLVLGAGVAGLQAIATARRLGAVVTAFDVRPVVKEQVESLGAKFLELDLEGTETAGGYAEALSEDQHEREQQLLAIEIGKSDGVITTALIPGQPAPELITEDAVRQMHPGSVIVDLAAEMGGNCALTVPGETVVRHDVTIIGELNLPSTMPVHASQMYARNVLSFLTNMIEDGELVLDFEDEVTRDTCVTHEGRVVKEAVTA